MLPFEPVACVVMKTLLRFDCCYKHDSESVLPLRYLAYKLPFKPSGLCFLS
jgi:hypothetical protein